MRVTSKLLGMAMACLFALSLSPALAKGQSSERNVEIISYSNQPLELVDIKLAGSSLKERNSVKHRSRVAEVSNLTFDSGDDWWKSIKFKVKNTSGKHIAAVEPQLVITHPALDKSLMVPVTAYLSGEKKLMISGEPLLPGAELELEVGSVWHGKVLDFMRSKGADGNVAAALFDIGFVTFSDGTAWSKGTAFERDPKEPSRWNAIKKQTSTGGHIPSGGTLKAIS